jgi:hypothetical protein
VDRGSRVVAHVGGAVGVVLIVLGGRVAGDELTVGPARLPYALVAAAAGLILVEAIWRVGLRPEVRWNDGGVVVVTGFTAERTSWQYVRLAHVINNQVVIETLRGWRFVRFDRPWWLRWLSQRGAARPARIQASLKDAQARYRDNAPAAPAPELTIGRRPW